MSRLRNIETRRGFLGSAVTLLAVATGRRAAASPPPAPEFVTIQTPGYYAIEPGCEPRRLGLWDLRDPDDQPMPIAVNLERSRHGVDLALLQREWASPADIDRCTLCWACGQGSWKMDTPTTCHVHVPNDIADDEAPLFSDRDRDPEHYLRMRRAAPAAAGGKP